GYGAPAKPLVCNEPVGDGVMVAGYDRLPEGAGLRDGMGLRRDILLCVLRGAVGCRGGQGPLWVASGRAGSQSAWRSAGLGPGAALRHPPFPALLVGLGNESKDLLRRFAVDSGTVVASYVCDHGAALRHRAQTQWLLRGAGPAHRNQGDFPGNHYVATN